MYTAEFRTMQRKKTPSYLCNKMKQQCAATGFCERDLFLHQQICCSTHGEIYSLFWQGLDYKMKKCSKKEEILENITNDRVPARHTFCLWSQNCTECIYVENKSICLVCVLMACVWQ